MARYSRAETGLRQTLLREFIKQDKLNLKKAYGLIERVLIAYGDDSVGELEGAHLSFEEISMLATKVIEHRRIGGSPIEQSTRYVRYDQKGEDGRYHYHLPRGIGHGEAVFRQYTERIFDCYAAMWEPLYGYLSALKPLEKATYDIDGKARRLADMATPKKVKAFQRTYDNDLKTKACDILRAFLPLSTTANVGLFGNGRFFQHLISKMMTSNLPEANDLGQLAFQECSKVIPHYVKRAAVSNYQRENEKAMTQVGPRYFAHLDPLQSPGNYLIEPDHQYMSQALAERGCEPHSLSEIICQEQDISFLSALVYGHVRGPFSQIRETVKAMAPADRKQIMDAYYGKRGHRRNRPERGIEFGYTYNFDLVTEWAVYKDLMRHRMGTIQIQPMAPDLGFQMPPEIEAAGLLSLAQKAEATARELYQFLAQNHPGEKEYAMLQGHRVRWFLGMNDRALMHMLELRTAPQGHPNYRATCQELHQLATARFPERAARMEFVNHDPVYWSRADAEARQREKEALLEGRDTP